MDYSSIFLRRVYLKQQKTEFLKKSWRIRADIEKVGYCAMLIAVSTRSDNPQL